MANWNQYWDRVAMGLCADCGNEPIAQGKKRGALCLERVKEYNKNARKQGFRNTPTPKQQSRVTHGILTQVQLAKEDVEAYSK